MSSYSVLMAVYHKELPDYLHESMLSILNQTSPTDDFVLVCDGPLGPELEQVIADMQLKFGKALNIVRLSENKGLGVALNTGIKNCKHELVARMDSDDISRPDRCEKQIEVFTAKPETDIVSGTVEEFSTDIIKIDARRTLPETNEQIRVYAKSRCPFNHPCVMYKKSVVESAGGYQHFYLLEDYYLWVRLLQNGAKGYNIQAPLLWMRSGDGMYKRRGGWKYAHSLIRLHAFMFRTGFISRFQFYKLVLVRFAASILPNRVRRWIYLNFLRER
jgi:glycosyltransferase involved in cell wall biosynthesis